MFSLRNKKRKYLYLFSSYWYMDYYHFPSHSFILIYIDEHFMHADPVKVCIQKIIFASFPAKYMGTHQNCLTEAIPIRTHKIYLVQK